MRIGILESGKLRSSKLGLGCSRSASNSCKSGKQFSVIRFWGVCRGEFFESLEIHFFHFILSFKQQKMIHPKSSIFAYLVIFKINIKIINF